MDPLSSNMTLIYRIYVKVMNTIIPDINLKSNFIKDCRGETTMFQINQLKANISILKTLKWNELTIPKNWTLQDAVSKRVQGANHTLENVIEKWICKH